MSDEITFTYREVVELVNRVANESVFRRIASSSHKAAMAYRQIAEFKNDGFEWAIYQVNKALHAARNEKQEVGFKDAPQKVFTIFLN